MSDGDSVAAEAGRLDKIEQAQEKQAGQLDRIEQLLAKVVPGSRADAQERTEQRLDRPSTIEEQVRAELEKRDRQAAEQQAADADKADRESIKEQLAKLREAPPRPPLSRATRVMWGGER